MAETETSIASSEGVIVPPESSETKEETNEISSSDGEEAKKGRKRPAPAAELDEDKKAERRAANRRSAFQSRQRRKILIEDLQRTVAALSKDNGDLRKSNEDLRVQLEAVLLENHQFRMQQQISGIGNPAAGLLGMQALQQQQSLMRGGAAPSSLAHLLSASSGSSGAPAPQTMDKSQGSAAGSSVDKDESQEKKAESGIQGILNAASVANGQGSANPQLQGLLQNPALLNSQLAGAHGLAGLAGSGGAGAGQLGGLQGLLEQLRGGAGGGQGGLADVQRALLQSQQGGGAQGAEQQGAISDALRKLLQK
eukprot:CAMPEP_0176021496 /NCGR_PEP_ID=MMETSP0120_2-20121206/10438_1 /TAXON_ID=160619 /ORGANISM="Kryptoperidinium foliaceum, Strain CCMP 1326" /LENGTH=309 /DNA_ID=CAMNT_0017354609 /DNA_START=123 /DNA_END=1052 /DNA_ORIENTATION=+